MRRRLLPRSAPRRLAVLIAVTLAASVLAAGDSGSSSGGGSATSGGYHGVDRQSLLLIRIVAVRMYDRTMTYALFRSLVDRLEPLGSRPEDVLTCLRENGTEDWYAGKI